MSSSLPPNHQNDHRGDIVENKVNETITINGYNMTYREAFIICKAHVESCTTMDIAIEVLERRASRRGRKQSPSLSDESIEKALPQNRVLCNVDNFCHFSWIGHGAFSVVLKAVHRIDRTSYALKVIPNISTVDQLIHAYREVNSLTKLINLHVVRYYSCWIEPKRIPNKRNMADIYDEKGNISMQKIIKKYGLDGGESDYEEEEESEASKESEVSDSTSSSNNLALIDRRLQFTNERLSKEPLSLIIQMEFCSNNLKDWIAACPQKFYGKPVPEYRNQVRFLFDQIVLGLVAIHDKKIIHRDIKPPNIFIHGVGKENDFFFGSGGCSAFGSDRCNLEACYHRLCVKIGDFGLSKVLDDSFGNGDDEGRQLMRSGEDGRLMLTANIGTVSYVAPEIISISGDRWTKYNEKADIYALGVVLLHMLHHPKTEMEMIFIIENLDLPKYLYEYWPVESKLLSRMLSKDPDVRPSAAEIKDVLTPSSEVITVDCFEVRSLRNEIDLLKAELDEKIRHINDLQREVDELKKVTHLDTSF